MRLSKTFVKTTKQAPADEVSKNAQLLIRAGFIYKEMAWVYAFLPFGWRVFNKIAKIIREEMDKIGGEEIHLTALQDPEVWKTTDRWSDQVVDVWFKTKLQSGKDLGLSFTHEEPLTRMMKKFVQSYKDLPAYPYQIQLKFRNEIRAKSGIMRAREFYMKDLYSFSKDKTQHDEFYEKIKQAYFNIFDRVGIGHLTYLTFASGWSFSKYSHEFQTLTEAGEDIIRIDEEKWIAINEEVLVDEVLQDLWIQKESLVPRKAVEVGNIFTLWDKFSRALGLTYKDKDGVDKYVFMGSYGIGLGRLMWTVAEVLSDDKWLVWPRAIAPYEFVIIPIGENASQRALEVYTALKKVFGNEIVLDDRAVSPGFKFKDADLIGYPYQIVISDKTLQQGPEVIEFITRATGQKQFLDIEHIQQIVSN